MRFAYMRDVKHVMEFIILKTGNINSPPSNKTLAFWSGTFSVKVESPKNLAIYDTPNILV